ncbi:Ig-like domain repeat protein [Methanobrevibacter sp.]|uniref:Ig-like domain repeat protein n=1 Tax=Methanobrevibacter sp. TaxID=66852 RepID=UPI002E783755|nr:Ig-like domain repeat protein [Methanobrevibacter sp.]MEE0939432.1 Ig-like domain repeat protein [Methanobrevibacter sp.]
MRYGKVMLIVCISMIALFGVSCVFANDAMNETISVNDLDVRELRTIDNGINNTNQIVGDSLSASVVYFDASANSDGDGSQSNPYKYYKSDRVDYGTTAYFANGVYDITEANNIYSSSAYKTTFIGQSIENTIFKSNLPNKFDFTVTDDSYFVLSNLTMVGVHINNQANLIANNVMFKNSTGFDSNYAPSLSYAYVSKIFDATCGGVIICDTPSNKFTTLNLTDCYFNDNSASSGGVIATYNTIANIQNCVFYNSSASRFGGVIYGIKSSLNIKTSSFELNRAKYAGAIYANSSTVNLKDSYFSLSQAYSFGGVIASFSSQLDINHVDFKDYASLDDAGGSIYSIGGTLDVVDSSFKNGSSDFGGSICTLKCDSKIANSEFTDNEAVYYGGSIYNMYGKIVLTGNGFKNTHARIGGSIFNRFSNSFTLKSNRFTDSTANTGDITFIDGDNANVVEKNNNYDTSKVLIKYGNIYDIDHYESVPLINYSAKLPESMPSFYDSRKYGYVTPAKDQIQGGNCWAFSGIATLEACLKKATGIEYDFSEENVKNLMSEYSLFDLDTGVNSGGNLYMFIAYLAGWFGPTYDENDVYDDYSALSVIYDSLIHVQNVYILPERESFVDNDHIKKAVLQYGAVSIGIDLSENQGHAVTIVGWDDEFVSNDFLGNKAVGAWIIKNSWGPNWESDGFGYLSYLQPIGYGYTFIFNDDRKYSDVYQYDFAGKSGYHNIKGKEAHIKNKFTAKKDEILSAFSTYFDAPSNFTVSVYQNGNLVTSQNGFHERGYYTIPFEKEVSLKKGDSFEIAVKFFNDGPIVYIPLCDADGINKMSTKGISFYSGDGKTWTDLQDSYSAVACIKAFTRSITLTDVSIDVDETGGSSFDNVNVGDLINIQLDLPEYYVEDGIQRSLDGLVTFTINGQNYFATVNNGKACLNFTFDKEGKYDVKAQFKSSRVISNIIEFTVNVVKSPQSDLVIYANDVSKFYGGPENYVVTLYNGDNALSGANVNISLNGKFYGYKRTDSNGQIVLDFSELPVGVYDVSAQYGGKVRSSKFIVLSTIIANDAVYDFLDSYISASFVNTDGEMLVDQKISFSVTLYGRNSNPVLFNATTDKLGIANSKVNLVADKYLISVINPVNGEEKQFTLEISQIDSKTSITVSQSKSNVTIINATLNSAYASGHVNFIVSDKVYKVNVQRVYDEGAGTIARASLTLQNLAVGDYSVSAVYSGDNNFRVSSSSRDFSVTEKPYRLTSENYWSYYGRSGTIAQLKDDDGNPVKGETVTATILNTTYTGTTDEDGLATFRFNLDAGTYTVLFRQGGQSLLKQVFIYSTIGEVTSASEYLNSKIGAYFIDSDGGKPGSSDVTYLVGKQVKFIANGTEYLATTDGKGYASANVDLPVGTHTITVVNLENGEKKQSKVTIYKATPTVTLTPTKRGNFMVFTASLTQTSAIGNVVFTLNSNKYTSPIIDGKAVLALNSIDEGSYSIYANYIGDSNFNNIVSSTIRFNYTYTNYTLSAPKVSKYYGGPEKFTVTLTDFNKPVVNVIINVFIGDKVYGLKTDSKGVASFDGELASGTHVVRCEYDEETVFSEIAVKPTINDGGDVSYSKITAEFRNGYGDLIKNTGVTFKIGSSEFKKTTNDFGVATLEVNLDKGNYTVAIVNTITGEIKYSTLITTKSTPNLSLTAVKENGFDVLNAVLPKTATGEVNFVLDNGDIYSVPITNGVSRLEGLDPGEYNVVVTYDGNDEFNPVSKSIKFSVSDEASSKGILISSNVKTTYGTSKNIVVTLKDSKGNILAGRKVVVNLNKKNDVRVMPTDGKAIVTVPSSLPAKTYTATITYAGETDISVSPIKIKVVVNKAAPKLAASKKTFKVKDKTKKYVVTLKTNKNKPYKKQKITIKVNGKTYSAKTNSKGQAIFKLTKLTKKGTFKAAVKYAGSSNFKAVGKTVKITVR